MGGKLAYWASALFLAAPTFAADIVRGPCDANLWSLTMPSLQLDEPALKHAYDKMVSGSLSKSPTNCTVYYPAENGNPIPGPRTVVMDKQWWVVKHVNGIEEREFRQHGMRFDYTLTLPSPNVQRRELTSFSVCRTADACRALGIPFSSAEEE